MDVGHRVLLSTLEAAHLTFTENTSGLSLDEALDAAGGYRSILGIAKHVAAWSAVYHSYAFEPAPRHWADTDWPKGLRERIELTREYLEQIIDWFERTYEKWVASLGATEDLEAPRPVHWGDTVSLIHIIVDVAGHWRYHAGEINAILAIHRAEAWEYTEEVEENHISSHGHGVRPAWMRDTEAARFEREHR